MTEQPPPDLMFASLVDKFKELDVDRSAPTSRQAFAELLRKVGYGTADDTVPHDNLDASWYAFVKLALEVSNATRPEDEAAGAGEEAPSGAAAAAAAATAAEPLDSVSQLLRPQPPSAAAGVEGVGAKEEESVAAGAPAAAAAAAAAAGAEEPESVPEEVAPPVVNEDEFLLYDFLNPFDLADSNVAPRNPSVLDTQGATMPGFRTLMRWSTKQPEASMMEPNDSSWTSTGPR